MNEYSVKTKQDLAKFGEDIERRLKAVRHYLAKLHEVRVLPMAPPNFVIGHVCHPDGPEFEPIDPAVLISILDNVIERLDAMLKGLSRLLGADSAS